MPRATASLPLALDIMEPFRPIIADSVVLSAVNTGEVSAASDFVKAPDGNVPDTSAGRRRFVGAFERRLSQEDHASALRLSAQHAPACCCSRPVYCVGTFWVSCPTYPHYLPDDRSPGHE